MIAQLKLVAPCNENRKVERQAPGRVTNAEMRSREYLTPRTPKGPAAANATTSIRNVNRLTFGECQVALSLLGVWIHRGAVFYDQKHAATRASGC
jgi:hypothetical protein